MLTGQRTPAKRTFLAVLAVAIALIPGWSVSGARPADRVDNPHEGIPCAGCHMSGSALATAAKAAPPEDASTPLDHECIACHTGLEHVSTLAAVFHGSGDGKCTRCHTFHDPQMITAGANSFRYAFGKPSVRMQCASCHSGSGSLSKVTDGHRDAAAAVYHVDSARLAELSPSATCLRCHSRDGGDPALPASAAQAPRFHEEATHPFGDTPSLGLATGGYSIRRKLDPRIALFDGRIECQTCHALADDVEDLLVRFENKYDMCLGCHERHPSGKMAGLAASTAPANSPDRAGLE